MANIPIVFLPKVQEVAELGEILATVRAFSR